MRPGTAIRWWRIPAAVLLPLFITASLLTDCTRRLRAAVIVVSLSFLMGSSAIAQFEESALVSQIDALFAEWNRPDSPGAAVVVVRQGEVVHQRQYGVANLEYGVPITSSTVFHIASVSKQFTAFSLLLLEDRGRLSLDDDIRKYVSEVPNFGETITIRHLLHHLSGLHSQETLLQLCGITNADIITRDDLMELVSRQEGLNFSPGDELEYSNLGYVLLAEVVRNVTGQSFPEWTSQNIFEPLGMINSQFYDDFTKIVENRAYPYWAPDGTELIKGILNYSYVGPTSLLTTATDMGKWLANFEHPTVGNRRIVNRMLSETGTLNNGEGTTYGFGLGITTHNGLNVCLHSGHDAAYRAFTVYFPDQHLGVAVLANIYSINPSHLGFAIADIYLADEGILPEPDSDGNARPGPEDLETESKEMAAPTKEDLSEYTGDFYGSEVDAHYKLFLTDGKLVAKHWRNSAVNLDLTGEDRFSGDQGWFREIRFLRDDDHRVVGYELSARGVRKMVFWKR